MYLGHLQYLWQMVMKSGLRNTFLLILFILLAGGYLVTVIPAGPTTQVNAEVVSRASRSGPTGNTGILITELGSGGTVSVEVPPIATVKTGDTVALNTHSRYIIGPKYSFAGKPITSK